MAGGLAGGLAALGGLVPGFDLVADLTGLARHVATADLIVTGEGRLDPPSFEGKVPGGGLTRRGPMPGAVHRRGGRQGTAAPAAAGLEIISLAARFGGTRARRETCALITEVTPEALPRFVP